MRKENFQGILNPGFGEALEAVLLQGEGDIQKPAVVISHKLGPREALEPECLNVKWPLEDSLGNRQSKPAMA